MEQGNSVYSNKYNNGGKQGTGRKSRESFRKHTKKNSDKRKTKLIEKKQELTWLLG